MHVITDVTTAVSELTSIALRHDASAEAKNLPVSEQYARKALDTMSIWHGEHILLMANYTLALFRAEVDFANASEELASYTAHMLDNIERGRWSPIDRTHPWSLDHYRDQQRRYEDAANAALSTMRTMAQACASLLEHMDVELSTR